MTSRNFARVGGLALTTVLLAGVAGGLSNRLIEDLRTLPFPVLSAVNGACAGAGVGVALAAMAITAFAVNGSVAASASAEGSSGSTVVVSEAQVDLGPGVVVGRLAQASTLSAPRIVAQSGALVHGTAWATQSGRVV